MSERGAVSIYCGTTAGVVRVNGTTGVVSRLGPAHSVESLAVSNGHICAAVTPDYGLPMRTPLGPEHESGIIRSVDGGHSWVAANEGLASRQVTALANSADGTTFYAGTDPAAVHVSDNAGGPWVEPGTLRTIPGYDSWTYPLPPHTPHVMWFAAHPQDRSRLLAGIEVGGLVHTADGGRSWSLVGEGINPDIHGLAIAPSQPEVVWAATPAGIYRSEDDGTHFRECNAGLPRQYARPIAVDCADDRVAYTVVTHTARGFFGIPAAETGGAVCKTTDGGQSWQELQGGLPNPLPSAPALAADPQVPDRLYLGTMDGAVYVSADRGTAWSILATGLPAILRFALSTSAN